MSLRSDLERVLSASGSVSIVMSGEGYWQINVRNKDMHSYHCHMAEDVFEGLAYSASKVTDRDLPTYDIFEAAKERRRKRKRAEEDADLIGDATDTIEVSYRDKSRDDDLI